MKKKIIASIIFLIICIASTLIYAAIDAKVEMTSSSRTVKPGDEVVFTVKVKDIVSENGVNGIEGTISYDTDKFEELRAEDLTKAGSWDVAFFNGKIIAEGLSAIKDNSDIVTIKLKIKEDSGLIGKTANVSFNNVVVYNTEKVDLGTVSASVSIEEGESEPNTTPTPTTKPTVTPDGGSESTPTPSTKPNTTGAPTATAKPNNGNTSTNTPITNIDTNTSSGNNTSNKGNTSSGSNTTNKGTTTSSSSLPKAGIGSTIAILTVLATAIGTVAYIKLRKYREI